MTRLIWLALAFVCVGCSAEVPGETRREQQSIELDGAESTRVNLEMNAGELRLSGGAAKLLEAEFTYNVEGFKPIVERSSGQVRISQGDAGRFTLGNGISRWNLLLNDSAALDVVANLGAGEAEMNLGSLNLRNLELGIGAGEAHVDLRGTPKRSYRVRINGGVGETVVYLPRTVGISASAAGGLGSFTVDGLEKRGERWINAGHENDPVQLTVDVKGGIGEIRVSAQ